MKSISEEYGADQAATGSAQSDPVVSVRGLVKRYGSQDAVAGIDLDVRRGEIFAFLGPNGAGKTTTVEILEGFRQRTEGQVSVLGHDPATAGGVWRDRLGVVLQESEPEPGLSVRECLAMYAGFYRAPRDIDETIALVGLTEKAGALGTRLSGGQRRRLDFALALIGDPELIFLDEPTTGFDPSARRAAWEVIAGLRQLGKTVFLTTHYMDEAEYLADRIMVLSAGRIVAEGTPRTLGGRDRMTTAISFTLPGHVQARDLPPELFPLSEPGAGRIDDPAQRNPASPLAEARKLGARPGLRPSRSRRPSSEPGGGLPVPYRIQEQEGSAMIRMALHLFGYDMRAFLRNRQYQFFTLALPVLFLVIFASVFGGGGNTTQVAGGRISTSVYYVPGIIGLGVIAACFGNLAASVTAQRERGALKRRRATPVPAAAVIAGRVLTAVVIAMVMAAVLLGIGWAAYGAHVPGRTALALAVTVVIGAASFCCLGYALTSLIRNEDAALPAAMALMLPLYFISGVFVAVTALPHWLADVGEIFPVRHLTNALLVAYNPHTTGLGFAGPDLLIVAAWGAAGLLIALRKFSWLPLGR